MDLAIALSIFEGRYPYDQRPADHDDYDAACDYLQGAWSNGELKGMPSEFYDRLEVELSEYTGRCSRNEVA